MMARGARGQSAGMLYYLSLQDLLEHGDKVGAVSEKSSPSYGKGTTELLAYQLSLSDPRARLISAEKRPLNLAYCIGNFFYQLSATDDVDSIAYYNPIAKKFSDDGTTLHGTYGPRMMRQIRSAIKLLQADPATRRAVVTIFDGRLDHEPSNDIPCPISMQFLVRDEKLVCISLFRSQNVLMVYPYDIFLFTMLHEWVAVHSGHEIGEHIQLNGSYHIYDSELELAKEVVDAQIKTARMPPMSMVNEEQWFKIMTYERQVRRWGLDLMPRPVMPGATRFWTGVMRWLTEFAIVKRKDQHYLRDMSMFDRLWE